MADEQVRLEQGMLKIAKSYGKAEQAARKMLAQFGIQIDQHNKVSAALSKQLIGETNLNRAIANTFTLRKKSTDSLHDKVKTEQEAIIVINALIRQEKK